MTEMIDYIEEVGKIVDELENLGMMPVLVGGMALVMMGSRRVTRDFDFLVSAQTDYKDILDVFYSRHFELASRIDEQGGIITTIDNKKIADIRLRLDRPPSIYFFNKKTGLRIDLLFDFPFSAKKIAADARGKKVRSYTFRIASKKDLLRLKEIASKNRALPTDAQDLEFLKKLLNGV